LAPSLADLFQRQRQCNVTLYCYQGVMTCTAVSHLYRMLSRARRSQRTREAWPRVTSGESLLIAVIPESPLHCLSLNWALREVNIFLGPSVVIHIRNWSSESTPSNTQLNPEKHVIGLWLFHHSSHQGGGFLEDVFALPTRLYGLGRPMGLDLVKL
jgi:hypothetical protein